MRAAVNWKTVNFAPTVTTHQHGRGVHDSTKGLGSTHSILQRGINRKCLVEQSGHVSVDKTSVVSRPPTPSGPGQCPNQTVESRINQVNQTHPSISWRGGCGCAGWTPGEEEEEGDLVTGPVEQWLKRLIKGSPSTPKPHITPSAKKGKAVSTSRDDIRSRLEAVRERRRTWEKHLAESSLGKGKGKRQKAKAKGLLEK